MSTGRAMKELNRRKKVSRFVAHFAEVVLSTQGDPERPEVLAEVAQQLQLAPQSEWARLAKAMKERGAPSIEAQRQIIAYYTARAAHLLVDPEKGQERQDGRPQAVETGALDDGRAYSATAVGCEDKDGELMGWSWWIAVEGGPTESGYQACPAPQFVFKLAKERVQAAQEAAVAL